MIGAGLTAFFTSGLGKVAILAIALIVWTLYQRDAAADKAREECQADHLRQTITEISRQRDAAKRALQSAREQTQQTTAEMTTLERDHAQLQKDYKDAQGACNVPDAATKRLDSIR